MNIALFHATLPLPNRKPGGVSVVVHRLAEALTAHPQDTVTVFSLTEAPPDAKYDHVQLFSGSDWLQSTPTSYATLPLLLNSVSFDDFDVMHLHGDDWFFLRRSLPTVRTMHGSALHEARFATSLKRQISQRLIYPFEKLAARLSTLTLAVGPDTADLYNTPHVVGNGVDFDRFSPGKKTAFPSILFVGTWSGRKRGHVLYDAFTRHIAPKLPDAHLYMVSDHCPPHEQVTHVPHPSDETLADLYRQSWVFAYPSVYEGFGIPYLEAMASGTAVVCSPNGGAQFVLDEGASGWIREDPQFPTALLHLLRNKQTRERLAEKGLRRARDFSWTRIAQQHRELYREAITAYHKPPSSAPATPVSDSSLVSH
jgi:phosphatidylinositol alpha-mannosyltransferase